MQRIMPIIVGLALGCGTPPLPGDSGSGAPSIRFQFPANELPGPVCADFLVVVDIDNFEVVPPDGTAAPVGGRGHWHLDDNITGDYIAAEWSFVDFGADLDGEVTRNYRLTASLVNIDHTPLSLESNPTSVDTVEFQVTSSADCLGGGAASEDTEDTDTSDP
ncbi:MAG: hypothetical protein CL927_08745 [Deltaproteobacteria bacterium]|nr:hypothetical protein [Deltaproteobacteria bacterium]HCH63247.1 hypothetical protein [Deltaproteobacteria bacterium]